MSISERQCESPSRQSDLVERQWLEARRKCGSPDLQRALPGGNGHRRSADGNRRGGNAERRGSDPQSETPMGISDAPMDFSEAPMAFVEPPTSFGKAHNTSQEVATAFSPGHQPGVERTRNSPSPEGATERRGAQARKRRGIFPTRSPGSTREPTRNGDGSTCFRLRTCRGTRGRAGSGGITCTRERFSGRSRWASSSRRPCIP
jgi:hypothetical protein